VRKASGTKNVFNLGHHDYLTVVDLANILFDELGLAGVKMQLTGSERGWVGDSPFVHLETTNIRKLGWKPETSIEEGIRRTIRFLKSNRHVLAERK